MISMPFYYRKIHIISFIDKFKQENHLAIVIGIGFIEDILSSLYNKRTYGKINTGLCRSIFYMSFGHMTRVNLEKSIVNI